MTSKFTSMKTFLLDFFLPLLETLVNIPFDKTILLLLLMAIISCAIYYLNDALTYEVDLDLDENLLEEIQDDLNYG